VWFSCAISFSGLRSARRTTGYEPVIQGDRHADVNIGVQMDFLADYARIQYGMLSQGHSFDQEVRVGQIELILEALTNAVTCWAAAELP
jgi:hypothetical protein